MPLFSRREFTLGLLPLLLQSPLAYAAGRVWNPMQFGARGDGTSLDTVPLQSAIDACAKAGGGTVSLGKGTYLCGSIFLRSGVHLLLNGGATLKGSKYIEHYRPTIEAAPPGVLLPGVRSRRVSLLASFGAKGIAITGAGTIDGSGENFWEPDPHHHPKAGEEWMDVSTFYYKPLPRPEPMIDLVDSEDILIAGVTLINSPSWTLRLHACDRVTVKGITIRNPRHGPNTDGIDVASSNVRITGCDITTGDDAICLKSEREYGLLKPFSNVLVEDCHLDTGCNGIKVGTGSQGSISGLRVRRCQIAMPHDLLRDRMISGIALETVDGGHLSDCVLEDLTIRGARTPIFIRLGDRGTGQPRDHEPGTIDGIRLARVRYSGAFSSSIIAGIPQHPVSNVEWHQIVGNSTEQEGAEFAERLVPEVPARYPEANMFGRLPSTILYCRHAAGVQLTDTSFTWTGSTRRPPFVFEDVTRLHINGMKSDSSLSGKPAFHMKDVEGKLNAVQMGKSSLKQLVFESGENSISSM